MSSVLDLQIQKQARVPASLRRLYNDRLAAGSPQTRQLQIPALPIGSEPYQIDNGKVLIEASSDQPGHLEADLRQLGLTDIRRFGLLVSGWLPIEKIPELETIELIRVLRPVPPALTRDSASLNVSEPPPGVVGDQGDLSMATDRLRHEYGVDGTGVTLAVISDSYNVTGGAAEDVAQGRLPGDVIVVDENTSGTDEGRAMLQLVHEVAPGAKLAFASSKGDQAGIALKVLELAGCPDTIPADLIDQCEPAPGVTSQVIVDDLSTTDEPFFQVGLWSSAVNMVDQAGVHYFTSAGNQADHSYQAWYRPSSIPGFGGGYLHDFDPGPAVDVYQRLHLPVGAQLLLSFQWGDQYASQCLRPCDGAAADFDIGLVGAGNGKSTLIAGSAYGNIGKDPIEMFKFSNDGSVDIDGVPGPDEYFNLVIEHTGGPATRLLKYIEFSDVEFLEYQTFSSTLFGHESAEGGMAIGAAGWQETPVFGQYPALAEPFSALGGTPILFNEYGQPIYRVPRQPGVLAPDQVQVWVEGNADLFQGPFPGTSAAAPHAAAATALLLSYGIDLSPHTVRTLYRETAIPWNSPPWHDFVNGSGFIDPLSVANQLFIRPDEIRVSVTANGKREELSAGTSPVSVSAMQFFGQDYVGHSVDLFIAVEAGGAWFSLVDQDGTLQWRYSGAGESGFVPFRSGEVVEGSRLPLLDFLRLQQALPQTYRVQVGVDRVANGRLDLDQFYSDTVTVHLGFPVISD